MKLVVASVIALAFAYSIISGPLVIPVLALIIGVALIAPLKLRNSFASDAESNSPGASGVSRREAMKRLGLGGAAVAIPLVGLPALIGKSTASAVDEPAVGPSGRVRQWGMLIDLRKCDGCQSQGTAPQCTTACIEGHFAPEPMEWIQVFEEEIGGGESGGTHFLPTPCQQCQNPPCVNVCPVAATFSSPEGVVLIDQQRCIGCRMCMAACPYDRRFFNWGDAPRPVESLLADYSIEHQIGAPKGTVMKCDFCPDMARAGTLPMCVQACPQKAIYYGDLEEDIATNGANVITFTDFAAESSSFRIKEDLGTEPRVRYIQGHGELVGRDKNTTGRIPTTWPWLERVKGSTTWGR